MKLEVFHCAATDGKGTHAPVLFVHGSYCAAWIWTEQYMTYFAEKGFSCHALSLRGHGGSEGDLSWASLKDYVDDVISVVNELDAPPILIGHSMGGLVVQHALAETQAKAAVLLSSVPPSGLASSVMHMSMFLPDVLWQLGLLQNLGPTATQPEAIRRAFLSDLTPPQQVAHLLSKLQRESHRIGAELLAPKQPVPPSPPIPVLVVGGDADVFLPSSAYRETATYFRGDLEILPGAPHGLMIDTGWWQRSADTIIAWLEAKESRFHAPPRAPRRTSGKPRPDGRRQGKPAPPAAAWRYPG